MAVYGVISIRNTNKKLSYRLQIAREQRPIPQKIAKLIYRTCIQRPRDGGGRRRWNFAKTFSTRKTRMIGLPCGEESIMTG